MGKKDKRIERARKAAIQQAADKKTIAALSLKPNSWYDGIIAPTKSTVVFRGMTQEISDKYSKAYEHDLQFPLQDFFSEIKTDIGILKIRWMSSFDTIVSKKAVRDYIANSGLRTKTSLKTENICAIVFASINDIYFIGYVVRSDISPDVTASSIIGITTQSYCDLAAECHKSIEKTIYRNKVDEVFGSIESITYTIQTFISIFLNDNQIPDLDISVSTPEEKHARNHRSTQDISNPAPAETRLANIYYNANVNKLVIGGGKNYQMKWWIVSDHKRHMADGRVIGVQPYIKGDKEDPDAIEALNTFITAQKRIKCFKLVPKKR